MKITEAQKKDLLLQFLIEERDKLLVSCGYSINDDNKPLYNSMTDQIARLTKELFEAKLTQSIPMVEARDHLEEIMAS
jgi:hypothetical protein